jgi:hypothetical protein
MAGPPPFIARAREWHVGRVTSAAAKGGGAMIKADELTKIA